MTTKITTETGRVYLIEDSLWMRLPKTRYERTDVAKLWSLKYGDTLKHYVPAEDADWTDGMPPVGKYMHISGKDFWWTSTAVVAVEEVDAEIHDVADAHIKSLPA